MARSRARKVAPAATEDTTSTAETTTVQVQPEGIVHGLAEQSRAELETYTPTETASDGPVRVNTFADDHAPAERSHASGFIANPSSRRRESHAESVTRRLPDKLTLTAGDMKVQMIDAGRNEMGIGIRVVFPEDRKPTDEEKDIIRTFIKGDESHPTGFKWDAGVGMWHKMILREGEHVDDVPPSRPVAIRLDAESRVQKLADALREHSADPVGYAEMVQQRREQSAESSRIPD